MTQAGHVGASPGVTARAPAALPSCLGRGLWQGALGSGRTVVAHMVRAYGSGGEGGGEAGGAVDGAEAGEGGAHCGAAGGVVEEGEEGGAGGF